MAWRRVWIAITKKPPKWRAGWKTTDKPAPADPPKKRILKRELALAIAQGELGTKEHPPNTNHCKYTEWYELVGAWCGIFVSWAYTKAGYDGFGKYAQNRWICYVPSIVDRARKGDGDLTVTKHPKPGDLVCYDWDGGVADHVGIFERWISERDGTFTAIEGNTAVGNDSNGGEVMRRQRNRAQVEAFVRVHAGVSP